MNVVTLLLLAVTTLLLLKTLGLSLRDEAIVIVRGILYAIVVILLMLLSLYALGSILPML